MEMNTEDSLNAAISLKKTQNPPITDSDSDDGILSGYSLPNFPELVKSSIEQQSSLTRSQYAMVVFHGVADTYPTDSDIVCRYSLTDGVEAAPGDRVVLFAVGWSSIKDYVVFEWAPIPEKNERDFTVVFKAADLPKDVNEFYQVCYVSNESAVCGASVPFQVRTPHNEELTFALEEDMVVVRSSTAVAQDKLLKAQLDRENLNKEKVNLEKQLRSLEDKLSLTQQRSDRLQETLNISNAFNEELKREKTRLSAINEQMLGVQKQLEEARIKLDNVEQEKKKLQKDVVKVNAVQDRNQHLEIMIRDLEDDLLAATEHIETLKKEREIYKNESAIANENLRQSKLTTSSLITKNFELENEFTVCKFNLNNTQLESLKLKTELDDLGKENQKLNEELRNAKQSEETHQNFSAQYSSTDKGRLIMDNTRLLRTTEDLQLIISRLEHEKSTLKQVLEDTLNAQKNVCVDHCTLEKRVAQLQYRLDEVSDKERVVEQKQSSSHTGQSSSLADQVETLSKLLDDSLKENELRLQENMALRVQNEILETSLSKEKSTSDEFVIVSSCDSSRGIQHNSTAGSRQSHKVGTSAANSRASVFALKDEIDKLRQRLLAQQELIEDYVRRLADKDGEISDMSSEMEALKTESLRVKEELKLEIASLCSKNAMLGEQEIQSRELKNEMQRITFMNEELLTQNSSLMARIHDDKGESSRNTDVNILHKTPNSLNVDTILEIENEHLKEHLKSTCEELNVAKSEVEREMIQLQKYKDRCQCLEEKLSGVQVLTNVLENRDSTKGCDMLEQRQNCSRECCAEQKLKEINQSLEHLLSAVEKLDSCSRVKENSQSLLSENNELKHRLELAREEYEKLHSVMVNYKTKYNELKTKYLKKLGTRYNFSN